MAWPFTILQHFFKFISINNPPRITSKDFDMKMLVLLFSVLSFSAQANVLKFDCQNEFENTKFGMSVIQENQTLKAYWFGTGVIGPSEVTLEVLSKNEALKASGVSNILAVLKLTPTQWSKVQTVEVYTSGNFDDDLAGVKGINLLTKNNKLVNKGMFFGWAGPQKCL